MEIVLENKRGTPPTLEPQSHPGLPEASLLSDPPVEVSSPVQQVFTIFQENRNSFISAAVSKGVSWESGEDAVQEAMISIWNARDRIQVVDLKAYAYQTVYRKGHDRRRSEARRPTLSIETEAVFDDGRLACDITASNLTTDRTYDAVESNEIQEQINTVLGQLSEDQRAILVSRFFKGAEYSDLMAEFGIEMGTAKSRLSRAREAFRQKYRELGFPLEGFSVFEDDGSDGSESDPQQ